MLGEYIHTNVVITSERFLDTIYLWEGVVFPNSKFKKRCYTFDRAWTGVSFAFADSPGCPSPTDSEVNMKDPSSSWSLILVFFLRVWFLLGKLKKQKLLGSQQHSGPERSEDCVRLVLYETEMKTHTGRRPCSRYSLAYKTSAPRPHGPVYIYGRENTRTHVHTRHVNPWDSPSEGGVGDGRVPELVETAR